jgi:2-amino-4-hydroxy-6-hydroxymethyldihydropteridine diphosphokinase
MARAAIGLGSNLGPEIHLPEGYHLLAAKVRIIATSRVYRTAPWGLRSQPDFLNAAVTVETELPPLALLDQLAEIESRLGRVRAERWGPRTLDLDLLLYDDLVMDSPRLTLPHSRLHERAFALVPLCELMPEALHPRLGRSLRALRDALPSEPIVPVALTLDVPPPA